MTFWIFTMLTRRGTALMLIICLFDFIWNVRAKDQTNVGEINTPHFILQVEGLDPAGTALFLEAAFEQMTNFFKLEPERKLPFKIFAAREGYQREIDRMRGFFAVGRLREADGGYLRDNATGYCYVQPGDYDTRCQILAVLAIQFADFVRPWRHVPSLKYCDYGLARYFALHNWDGKVLQLGIVPPISSEDSPHIALDHFRNRFGRDLQGIVDGKAAMDIPVAWGLVSFLVGQHRARFDIWRQALNNDVDPPVAWRKQFGSVTPEFVAAFEAWLQSNAPPWQVLSGNWQPSGEAIKGHAEYSGSAGAVLAKVPRQLTVTLDLPATNAMSGVIFGLRSGNDYRVLQRVALNEWSLLHFRGAQVLMGERPTFPAAGQRDSITIEPGERMTRLNVNGQTLQITNVTGSVGVYVEGGPTRFWCSWK